jgi:hypothetical protein
MFKKAIFFTLILLCLLISFSCQKQNQSNISAHDRHSHNMGKNCMDCHVKDGPGRGWFNIAGTVYDTVFPYNKPNPNGTVFLYSNANRTTLVTSLEVDNNGNFYTTDNVNFGNGLYPKVVSKDGDVKYMGSIINNGACNSCHNYNTFKIYIK